MGLYEVLGKAGVIKDAPIELRGLAHRLRVDKARREGAKDNPMNPKRFDKYYTLKIAEYKGIFKDFKECEERVVVSKADAKKAKELLRLIKEKQDEPITRIIKDALLRKEMR